MNKKELLKSLKQSSIIIVWIQFAGKHSGIWIQTTEDKVYEMIEMWSKSDGKFNAKFDHRNSILRIGA